MENHPDFESCTNKNSGQIVLRTGSLINAE